MVDGAGGEKVSLHAKLPFDDLLVWISYQFYAHRSIGLTPKNAFHRKSRGTALLVVCEPQTSIRYQLFGTVNSLLFFVVFAIWFPQ